VVLNPPSTAQYHEHADLTRLDTRKRQVQCPCRDLCRNDQATDCQCSAMSTGSLVREHLRRGPAHHDGGHNRSTAKKGASETPAACMSRPSEGCRSGLSRLERANIISTASSEPCYEGLWQEALRYFSAQASAAEDPRSGMLVDRLMADFDHHLGELTSHGSDDASTWAHMPPRPRTCNHGDSQ
jgi:hypothetical protein